MRDARWVGAPRIPHPPSRVASEFGRSLAEDLHPVLRHHAVILYSDPELPELINPGLDREHHAGLETRRVAFDEILGLVAIHPEPVAQAVREEPAVARSGDDLARGAVHRLARRARAPQLHRGGLGVVHHVEHLAELVRRVIAEPDGARDVGSVAAHPTAAIDQYRGLALELGAGGAAVRQRAGRAELHEPASRSAALLHF